MGSYGSLLVGVSSHDTGLHGSVQIPRGLDMGLHRSLLASLSPYKPRWVPVCPHGSFEPSGVHISSYGSPWSSIGPHGSSWIVMNPYKARFNES